MPTETPLGKPITKMWNSIYPETSKHCLAYSIFSYLNNRQYLIDTRRCTAEHARLNDQVAGYTELMKGKIIHAPLSAKMFDVGCGTGIVTRHLGIT